MGDETRMSEVELGAPAPTGEAIGRIHGDLNRLKRDRILALTLILIITGVALAGFELSASEGIALNRSPRWGASMALFFTAAAIAASLTLGLPLWKRVTASAMTFAVAVALVTGLALLMNLEAPFHSEMTMGMPCLGQGTVVGVVALLTTALLTGRLWRRMADLSWITALGASAVGLAMLSARCGHNDPVHLFGFHLPIVLGVLLVARGVLHARQKAI